ncbi:MAG: SDR family oxidoreductase [Rhodobacteraceae bacterium]|jgi:glucose 1-dehydrogenase|nr:SDR family oxidoreductase [Paracoccaceae bacterium]
MSGSMFSGQVCVVTGAAGGIGRATAVAMAKEGARVAILDKNAEGAAETLRLVQGAGGDGIALSCDTTDAESVGTAHAAVVARLGDADILVNNAGVGKFVPLAEVSLEEWNRVIAVNVTGYFICAQAFGRAMLARHRGAIVNISSIGAVHPNSEFGSYSVSKAGASMLTKLLAAEWGPYGVRCNAVLPGMVHTPMTAVNYASEEVLKARSAVVPMRRIGSPEDIAAAVLYLAGPNAAYVTGAELVVDGGLTQNYTRLIPRAGQLS